jgi:cytochrome P450
MENLYSNTKTKLPGPRHVPILGWRLRGLSMLRDPIQFFMSMYKHYGPISAWDPENPRQICAFGPDLFKEIITQPDIFILDGFREGNLPTGSSMERLTFGLTRLNGTEHHRHRRLIQPAFKSRIIHTHYESIVKATENEIRQWKECEKRDINNDMTRLITRISMKTMFGLNDQHIMLELQILIRELIHYAGSPLSFILKYNIPGTPYAKMLNTADKIEEILRQIIESRRGISHQYSDVLSILMGSNDNGSTFTYDELIGEAYTILCHESSAAALTWCFLMLDQHPSIYSDLMSEINSILGNRTISIDDIDRLPLLDAVVKEILRLFPSAPFITRYATTNCELGGYPIQKNALIFLSGYVSHRSAAIFSNPLKFDPYRWFTISPAPNEYTAFGAGAHSCIGKYFALFEIKIVLTMILQKFKPILVENSKVDRGMRISLIPNGGLPVILKQVGHKSNRTHIIGNITETFECQGS